jgi:hypothetical protein
MSGIDQYTKLLLHMDDVALSDSSPSSHSVQKKGDVLRSSAQSKFGGYSGYFDGVGDYLQIPDSNDWHLADEDFTLDFWVRFTSLPGGEHPVSFSQRGNNTSNKSWTASYNVDGNKLKLVYSTDGSNNIVLEVSWSPTTHVWYHVAYVRNGSDLKFFVDGNQIGTTQNMGTDYIFDSTSEMVIGTLTTGGTSQYWNELFGYIDEMRLSKGIARWTSNFTPPTEAYSRGLSVSATISGSVDVSGRVNIK